MSEEISALKLRLADLARLRDDYADPSKAHFVSFIDRVIAEVEEEIAKAEAEALKASNRKPS